VALNLLSNAAKFTFEGAIRVIIDYNPESKKLNVKVADTGIGIS
jgi:signal transduction histidine kinase